MDRPLDVHRVPERDGGCDESEATCAVALLLEAAISDFSQAAKEYGSGKGIARFTFVETGMDAASQFDALQPGEDEQCPFDPAQCAQGDSETVLAGVAAQLAKHERGRYGALLDRRCEMKDIVPVSADSFQVDCSTNHRHKRWVFDLAVRQIEPCVAQVADARREAKTEQMHEGEDVIGEARGVGVMLFNSQVGLMVKQAVEDVRGVSRTPTLTTLELKGAY